MYCLENVDPYSEISRKLPVFPNPACCITEGLEAQKDKTDHLYCNIFILAVSVSLEIAAKLNHKHLLQCKDVSIGCISTSSTAKLVLVLAWNHFIVFSVLQLLVWLIKPLSQANS